MSNQKDIFISYCSVDFQIVNKEIYQVLQKINVSAWFDKHDIGPSTWIDEIKKGLRECKLFLICIGRNKLEKTNFQKNEIYVAILRHACGQCSILPVLLSDWENNDNDKICKFLENFQNYGINKKLFYDLNQSIKMKNANLISKLFPNGKYKSKVIDYQCEKKLIEIFNNVNFYKYSEYLKNGKNEKIQKLMIIGDKKVFKFQIELTKTILNLTNYKPNNIYIEQIESREQARSDIFWGKLFELNSKDLDKHKLITKISSEKGYVFVSFIIEEGSKIDVELFKQACDTFFKDFNESEKNSNMKLFFYIYTSSTEKYDSLEFTKFDFDFINSNCNEQFEQYEEKCLQQLINNKKFFFGKNLNNSYTLYEELKKLICNQEEE